MDLTDFFFLELMPVDFRDPLLFMVFTGDRDYSAIDGDFDFVSCCYTDLLMSLSYISE